MVRYILVSAIALCVSFSSLKAQDAPKPGPEIEMLKKWEGKWDATMKMMGAETKGMSTFKMDLGGLWLSSTFEIELFGSKFTGKGMDTYNEAKKKYVSVWLDSMSTYPMIMEGTFDKETKKLTMAGESQGPDGKPMKMKSVTMWKDDDTVEFSMYMGDEKEPGFTVVYKRKK